MKQTIILLLLLVYVINSYSQDTIRHYVNNRFITIEKDSASYIREVIIHENYYSMSYLNMEGDEINYCEFKSPDPFILEGRAKHYYAPDTIYSTGSYCNDKLIGRWLYYNINGDIDTVTYQPIDYYKNLMGCTLNNSKLKNPPIETDIKIQESLTHFLTDNFHIPARSRTEDLHIAFGVKMIIDIDGRIKNIEIVNSNDEDLQLEVYRILSMYKSDFEINKAFQTTLYFDNKTPSSSDEEVYIIVENMPEFPGGIKGLNDYIARSLNYPVEAQQQQIEGRVYLSFVVDKNGKVRDVKIAKGCHYYLDQEALRVVREMPDWTPGFQKGKPVNVSYTVPVCFVLE